MKAEITVAQALGSVDWRKYPKLREAKELRIKRGTRWYGRWFKLYCKTPVSKLPDPRLFESQKLDKPFQKARERALAKQAAWQKEFDRTRAVRPTYNPFGKIKGKHGDPI